VLVRDRILDIILRGLWFDIIFPNVHTSKRDIINDMKGRI
jgi:hypothetical protein